MIVTTCYNAFMVFYGDIRDDLLLGLITPYSNDK